MPSTSCWLRSRKALSKKDRCREPTENFPAGISGHNGKVDDRRLAVGRQDAAPVAARCDALDRQRRSEKHSAKRIDAVSRLKTSLPESLATTVKSTIADWQSGGKMQRLWQRDATLWTGSDEAKSTQQKG